MNSNLTRNKIKSPEVRIIVLAIIFPCITTKALIAFDFPTAGWHRGDLSAAQENSCNAVTAEEWSIVERVDWLELYPVQIDQYIQNTFSD